MDHNIENKEVVKRFEQMIANNESLYFDIESYEQIVHYYMEKAEYEKALQACDYALNQYKFSLDLFLLKAEIQLAVHQYELALELLDEISSVYPNDPDVLLLKAKIHINLKQYDAAIELLHYLLPISDRQEEILGWLALSYQSKDQYLEAAAYYEQAIVLDPDDEDVAADYYYCLDCLNDMDKGVRFFENRIDEDPYDYLAWFRLGELYAYFEEHDQAIYALEYAVIIKEDFSDAYFRLGLVYIRQNNFDKAQEVFLRSWEYEKEDWPDLLCYIAHTYEQQGDFEKALKFYRKASRIDPLWDQAWYGMGCCLNAMERWYEALMFLKKAYKINENSSFLHEIANTEFKIGNVVSALEAYEKASEYYYHVPKLWLDWSYVYFEQGDMIKALDILESGVEEIPDSAELYYRKAAYLIEEAKYKEAIKYIYLGLDLDYEGHIDLISFFDEIEIQKVLYKIIEQYKK